MTQNLATPAEGREVEEKVIRHLGVGDYFGERALQEYVYVYLY